MRFGYSFNGYDKENMARVVGRDMSISTKHAIEICTFIKKKKLSTVKKILEDCIDKKKAIPFRRFTNGLGHKKGKGVASGRYPKKAAESILNLVESLEANAQQKGLNTSNMIIIHAVANRGARPHHHSRHRGRQVKNTHVELCSAEAAEKKENAIKKKETKKPEVKETKQETVKEIKKQEKVEVKETKEIPKTEENKSNNQDKKVQE